MTSSNFKLPRLLLTEQNKYPCSRAAAPAAQRGSRRTAEDFFRRPSQSVEAALWEAAAWIRR